MTGLSLAPFLAGVSVGLAVAVPIGPMGVLCIQRSLAFGPLAGLTTGLGAATVHLAFGAIATVGLGVTASVWLGGGVPGLHLISAGLLFWFAVRALRRETVVAQSRPRQQSWFGTYASALVFGLSNPMTVLLFVAALPAVTGGGDPNAPPLMVAGVFFGSISWWFLLSTATGLIRGLIPERAIALTNKVSGLTFAALGSLMLAHALGLRGP